MKLVLAKWTADRVGSGHTPDQAAADAIHHLKNRVNGHGGIIVLNRKGEFGIFHNTPKMAWGVRSGTLDVVGVEKH